MTQPRISVRSLARHLRTALVLVACVPAAHAAMLVSNIDQPRRSESTIQAAPSGQVTLPWAAQSFATDGQAYRLDAIDAVLGTLVGTPDIVAELRADTDGSAPGALITTLNLAGPGIPAGSPLAVALVPAAATELAANTTYWLVLGALGGGSYGWEYAQGNGFSGPGSFGNFNYSDDQGLSWTGLGSDNLFKLEVNVSAVPLPGVALLFAAAAGGLLGHPRRARRAR